MKKLLFITLLCPFIFIAQTKIGSTIVGEPDGGLFGFKISLSSDGNIIAVSSPGTDVNGDSSGSVRVYKNNNDVWEQLGATFNGVKRLNGVGSNVSLSSDGSVIAIAAGGTSNNFYSSGFINVYRYKGDIWEQIGDTFKGFEDFGRLGNSLSLSSDGTILAATSSNKIIVYKNNNDIWEQVGTTIEDTELIGINLSLSSDGNTIAIGSQLDNRNGSRTGYARIFKNNNGVWEQIGDNLNGIIKNDNFGRSISLSSDGSIVAIGANFINDPYFKSSYIKIYKNNEGVWEQFGSDINGKGSSDSVISISLSSDASIIAIGHLSGKVKVYKNNNGVWEDKKTDFEGLNFNVNLSSDGNILAVSNPRNNPNSGLDYGVAKIYDLREVLSSSSDFVNNFTIYPNPTSNQFTIQLNNAVLKKVKIFNNLGQFIKSSKKLTINTANLSKGIYFLQVETNKGKDIKKLIVE